MEKGLPAAAINLGRRVVPASKRILANSGEAVLNAFTRNGGEQSAAGVPSPAAPTTPGTPALAPGGNIVGAGNPGWSAGGVAREIEMSPLMAGSPVDGLRRRAGDGDAQHSPSLAGLETDKDL